MTQGNSPLDSGWQGQPAYPAPHTSGGMQPPAGGELPGVALPPPAPAPTKSNNKLVVSLVAIIVILVVALILALIRPWDDGSQATPAPAASSQASEAAGNEPSAGETSEAGDDASVSPTSTDEFQQRETDLAQQRNWIAGQDYIPSQPEAGRDLIASIPHASSDSGMTLGPDDAPVLVHLFADFSCPVCTTLHLESMPELEELARNGEIQIQWHNFVIFPEYGSDKAARGAIAAANQGKLWEFVDAAFNTAEPGGHPTYTDDSVLDIAQEAGITDVEQFTADFAAADTQTTIDEEGTLASETLGLTGTPAMFINSSYMAGAYPLDVILNTIEIQADLAAD
ncbi:thioredoxin domain-containing protein [Actinomycetaceae bacterium L2_0104]